jgi:hypothetical protein
MAPKQRQIRIENKSALAAMQQLETRPDDELEAETKFRAAAQAILGARAAEKMDAKKAREHFRQAIAAARPQERLQLRRMAEASLALAERRAGDLKSATEKLGQTPPTGRQLMMLRFLGLVHPPPGSNVFRRIGGILLLLAIIALLIAAGTGIALLIGLAFGGVSIGPAIFYGILIVLVVLVTLVFIGRKRQKKARARAPAKASQK